MLTSNSLRRRQRGFALLEALVAMLIMTIGVLSLAAMQTTINRYSNEAKLRSDASRLAQEQIETLRSYTGIAETVIGQGTTSGTAVNWDMLTSGSDNPASTNATYTRTWTLSGAINDSMRQIQVSMAWVNRSGESQSLTISSVISKTDPADSGYLNFPLPLNTNLKRPKDRNLDIPVRAVDLGDGKSGLRYGTGGQYLVFSNVSGDVVKICVPPSLTASSTDAQIIAALTSTDAATASCTTLSGFIVAGYIKRGDSVSSTDWDAVKDGLGMSTLDVVRNADGASPISCNVQDATDQNNGALIANWKSYICVIPLAPSSPGVPYDWSGTIRVSGPNGWHGASSKYYVCRFQYTATNTFTDPNLRNVQSYVAVNKSIDQQNYLLATTNNSTDTSQPTCNTISEMNVSGVSTGVLHQDCRGASNSAGYATQCPVTSSASTYALTYNGNQNTGGTAPTDANLYVAGSLVTVLAKPSGLERDNHTFGGWNRAADGSGTNYDAGDTFTISGPTTLYAKWVGPATITYASNGANSGTVPTDATNYSTGDSVTVLGNPGSLTKADGSNFVGWSITPDGLGASYTANQTFTITGNTTLYAKWSSASLLSVTYHGNTSTGGTAPTDSTSYASGATVTVMSAGSLTKSNATFTGWNTAANGSGTPLAVNQTFPISQSMNLYAQWQATITLGTPQLTWQSGAPYTLTWTAITGATGYSVRTCTDNGTTLTACTPSSPASQTATSVTANPGNNKTFCYTVTATGPSPAYNESPQSAVKCIHYRSSNSPQYTTQ